MRAATRVAIALLLMTFFGHVYVLLASLNDAAVGIRSETALSHVQLTGTRLLSQQTLQQRAMQLQYANEDLFQDSVHQNNLGVYASPTTAIQSTNSSEYRQFIAALFDEGGVVSSPKALIQVVSLPAISASSQLVVMCSPLSAADSTRMINCSVVYFGPTSETAFSMVFFATNASLVDTQPITVSTAATQKVMNGLRAFGFNDSGIVAREVLEEGTFSSSWFANDAAMPLVVSDLFSSVSMTNVVSSTSFPFVILGSATSTVSSLGISSSLLYTVSLTPVLNAIHQQLCPYNGSGCTTRIVLEDSSSLFHPSTMSSSSQCWSIQWKPNDYSGVQVGTCPPAPGEIIGWVSRTAAFPTLDIGVSSTRQSTLQADVSLSAVLGRKSLVMGSFVSAMVIMVLYSAGCVVSFCILSNSMALLPEVVKDPVEYVKTAIFLATSTVTSAIVSEQIKRAAPATSDEFELSPDHAMLHSGGSGVMVVDASGRGSSSDERKASSLQRVTTMLSGSGGKGQDASPNSAVVASNPFTTSAAFPPLPPSLTPMSGLTKRHADVNKGTIGMLTPVVVGSGIWEMGDAHMDGQDDTLEWAAALAEDTGVKFVSEIHSLFLLCSHIFLTLRRVLPLVPTVAAFPGAGVEHASLLDSPHWVPVTAAGGGGAALPAVSVHDALSSISQLSSVDDLEPSAMNLTNVPMRSPRKSSLNLASRRKSQILGCQLTKRKFSAIVAINIRHFHSMLFHTSDAHTAKGMLYAAEGNTTSCHQSDHATTPANRSLLASGSLARSGASTSGLIPNMNAAGLAPSSVLASANWPFARWYGELCDRLCVVSKLYRGSIDFFHGDHLLISFNATTDCTLPGKAAVMSVLHLKELFSEVAALRDIECGIALGQCFTGFLGTDATKRAAIIGPAVNTALELQRIVRRCPESYACFCLTTARLAAEMNHEQHFMLVGATPLPTSATTPAADVGVTSVNSPTKVAVGADEEPDVTRAGSVSHESVPLQNQAVPIYSLVPYRTIVANRAHHQTHTSHLPSQGTPSQAGSNVDEEWLYQVGANEAQNPFVHVNEVVHQILSGNMMAAEALYAQHIAEQKLTIEDTTGTATRPGVVDDQNMTEPVTQPATQQRLQTKLWNTTASVDAPSPRAMVTELMTPGNSSASPKVLPRSSAAIADAMWESVGTCIRKHGQAEDWIL